MAQNDSKQQVKMNLDLNLGMKLIFCIWLSIHKYNFLIQPIHIGVLKHLWAFQK